MAKWTDSQSVSGTVASTSETSLGTISIPSNQRWRIYGLFGTSVGGTYRIAPSTLASGKFEYFQNSNDQAGLGANNIYTTSISLNGPCDIECFMTNAAATSTTNSRVQMMYEVTTGGQ